MRFWKKDRLMLQQYRNIRKRTWRSQQGLTLVELLVAFFIAGLAVAGIVNGYVFSVKTAERFALSQAASAMASKRMEMLRGASWDPTGWPPVDQLQSSNFPTEVVTLDLSGAGTNQTPATNYATISDISTNPPLRRVRVDCVWPFYGGKLITNTIESIRCPN